MALKFKRPVYLEVPRDMVFADVSPLSSVEQVELRVDAGAVEEAAQEIVSRLRAAKNPVLIVGVEVHRFHLIPKVLELAERLQIPVTSSFLGRGVFPTRHPQFIGTYLGGVSPQPLREIVESSDCLLLLGELVSDTSLGVSADRVNEDNLIVCVAREVFIKYHQFQHTPIDMLVDRLLMSDLPVRGHIVEAMGTDVSAEIFDPFKQDEQIKMKHVIKLVNEFVEQHPEFAARRRHRRCAVRERRHPLERMHCAGLLRDDGFCGAGGAGGADCQREAAARAGRRRRVSDDRQRDLARAQVRLQPDRRAAQQQPMGDAAGVLSGGALQRDGRVAVLEARRAVGRPRIPRAHAAAVQGRARRGIRGGEALLADRGRSAARRHLADSSRVRARGEDAGACQIRGQEGRGQRAQVLLHLPAMLLLAALSIVWTWPLALHFSDHIPGLGGDNYSFLWNLWWMRKALSSPELEFFQSTYLFSPFGVDLINHPHTALQGYLSATALGGLSVDRRPRISTSSSRCS